jgi:hypothetical protein
MGSSFNSSISTMLFRSRLASRGDGAKASCSGSVARQHGSPACGAVSDRRLQDGAQRQCRLFGTPIRVSAAEGQGLLKEHDWQFYDFLVCDKAVNA